MSYKAVNITPPLTPMIKCDPQTILLDVNNIGLQTTKIQPLIIILITYVKIYAKK